MYYTVTYTLTLSLSLSLSLFHVAPILEHRASVKSFVSLQFLTPRQSVGLLERGISRRKAATYTNTE
jgi:hypothetical protein